MRKVINNTCRCSDINSHYANMHRCKDDAVRGFINGYVKLLVDKDQYLYDRRDKYYNAGCEMMDVRFEVFENNNEEFQIGVAYGARSGYETIDCIFTPPKHIDMLKEFILDNHSCCDRMDDNEITRWVNIASEHRTLPGLKFNCIYDNWQKLREYFQKMCQAGEPDAEQWGQRALACAEKIKGEWDREWATVNSLLDLSKYYLNKMLLSEAEPLIVRVLNISDYDEFRHIYPELYEEIWFAAGLYNLKHEKYLEAEPYFDEVLYFRKRRLGPRDFSLVAVFESLAEVYAKTDRNDAANESLNSAASISPHKYNKINTS
ncbi:MAG TPA: tetratricopeptide repeat protein, partial [Bacteroidaceae bacterium]|nr:tetratricopeptide repeat protein [Bacteroidaceae bacterium]